MTCTMPLQHVQSGVTLNVSQVLSHEQNDPGVGAGAGMHTAARFKVATRAFSIVM